MFDAWLSALSADGLNFGRLKAIRRGLAYSTTLQFEADLSASTITGAVALGLDPSVAPIATFDVLIGAFDGTVTPVTLSLGEAIVEGLPPDGDGDGVDLLAFDLLEGDALLCGGTIPIIGGVVDDDA